ncbi:hypothetical protein L1987_30589 [Smallanthus sonchifolius]|uniref:Uncharacterized protein n=1 Tax=Smallanthus sonchifolius TaxID=185202 RepID=A0ACB9I3W1_9ASTR|nr:hypothetical protein L1987_30589 [Smallanthus sonchifolius]
MTSGLSDFTEVTSELFESACCVALQALKHAWQGPPLSSWRDDSDPCGGDWVGITCTNSRVTSIILSSTGLTGGLPGDIGQFTELVVL